MKTTIQIPLVLGGLALGSALANAQGTPSTPVAGTQHSLALGLVISSQGTTTTKIKTRGSTTITTVTEPIIVTKRFSNRELLNLLVTKGVITSITGWSLSYYTDLTGQNVGTYIVKSGATPIKIDSYLSLGTPSASLQQSTSQTRTTGTTSTTTVTGWNLSVIPVQVGAGFHAQGALSNDTSTSATNATTIQDFEVDGILGTDAYDPTTGAPVPFVSSANSILQGWIYGGWGQSANLPSSPLSYTAS